jgi:NAD-specific glutamate dehydrogenase
MRLVEGTNQAPADLAAAYAKLGDRSGINWVFQNVPIAPADDVWDRIVLMDLRTELLALQRDLTREALAMRPEAPLVAVDDFLLSRASVVARVRALIAQTAPTPTASALAVVTQTLMRLRTAEPFG